MIEQKKNSKSVQDAFGALTSYSPFPSAAGSVNDGMQKLEKLRLGTTIDDALRQLKQALPGSTPLELPPITPIVKK